MSDLSDALTELRDYVESQRTRAARRDVQQFWERDMRFLDRLSVWATSGVPSDLNRLLEEMRGTSQGFGSYAEDLERLDELLNGLVTAAQQTMLASRLG